MEALEIHYRIHTIIFKYLINNRRFSARMFRQLKYHLIRAARSPFAIQKSIHASSSSTAVHTGSGPFDSQVVECVEDLISLVSEREIKFDVTHVRAQLVEMCLLGLKRCVVRYHNHYKSYYRLASHYLKIGDLKMTWALLLGVGGAPVVSLGSGGGGAGSSGRAGSSGVATGLFSDRKPNNLFYGKLC